MPINAIVSATRFEFVDHRDCLSARTAVNLDLPDNRLLGALPRVDLARLAPLLQRVNLKRGQILSEQACELQFVYFPVSAVLSQQYTLGDGSTCEIAGVGSEGVIGASLFMYDSVAPSQTRVLIGGGAYRGAVDHMGEEFSRGGALQRLMLRYVQSQFMQMTQLSMCNSRHPVVQRLCRWLLGTLDRGVPRELVATHDRLAEILGVRRESVTAAAGRLQECGAIRYARGRLTVLDRDELESRACECYAVVRQLQARLLQMGAEPSRPARASRPFLATVRAPRGDQSNRGGWSQPALM